MSRCSVSVMCDSQEQLETAGASLTAVSLQAWSTCVIHYTPSHSSHSGKIILHQPPTTFTTLTKHSSVSPRSLTLTNTLINTPTNDELQKCNKLGKRYWERHTIFPHSSVCHPHASDMRLFTKLENSVQF